MIDYYIEFLWCRRIELKTEDGSKLALEIMDTLECIARHNIRLVPALLLFTLSTVLVVRERAFTWIGNLGLERADLEFIERDLVRLWNEVGLV